MKLNLGSYKYPLKGYINVDIEPWSGVDVVCDLNELQWPFLCGEFEEVRAIDILEHLGKLTKVDVVQELARILKTGGKAIVRVPCVTHVWAFASLQHAHAFYFNSFDLSYAQPWFRVNKIYAGISDKYFPVPYTRWTRPFLKFLSRHNAVQTITFELEKL